MSESSSLDRREFLKVGATIGAGLAAGSAAPTLADAATLTARPSVAETMIGVRFGATARPRIAIVGTGLRGRSVLHELLGVGNVQIAALCDVVPEKVAMARDMVRKAGQSEDVPTFVGERAFEQLVQRDDIDLVYTATPWEWHVPVCLAAMNAGKHAATEVPAAYSIEDCWSLVDTSERTRRHCIMMENCNYGYNELLVLNLVRAGVLGEILHGGAAYNHDLRQILFETRDEGLWRRRHHTLRDANLYPTHGLGPVALYMDIDRGDRFEYLVSMSTPAAGLARWREEHQDTERPKNAERYVAGDLNSSLIKTAKGRTIRLEHDVSSPRPYSRINSVQGTKGIFEDYPARIYVDGMKPAHQWGSIDPFKATHEHELWRTLGQQARSGGHGGMDFVMAWRLVHCMREGLVPDMDVYDAAAWSAPGPLSEQSVKSGSAPVAFPDFTRGKWREARRTL
ncbi:MAG: Gfo/Idh/MocA family oxidoreductase [Gemmatimonadaceae bacterium]|nr:Gfo/Idh/MocA family oxidoreductase [Gemmatimonadaceae bacterium]